MDKPDFFDIESLGDLYIAVQSSAILEDSKTFVDCIPKYPAGDILAKYEAEKSMPGFSLKTFVATHFDLPQNPDTGYESGQKTIREHLDGLWNVLSRNPDEKGGTLIPLPKPYIVPGGRFREIYYWDSYFTMLGLQVSGRIDIIRNMVDNFAWLLNTIGFIPNGNRTYYLGRSQPPFFALMVRLLAETDGENTLLKYRPHMEREYAFWMDGAEGLEQQQNTHRRVVLLPDAAVMNRYWDDRDSPRPEAYIEDIHVAQKAGGDPKPVWRNIRAAAESGWDFSSRWFRKEDDMSTIQTTSMIPVDLNCLLWNLEETLLEAAKLASDEVATEKYTLKSTARRQAIEQYCWDETSGFYFDYHFADGKRSDRKTLAGVFPLFFRIASDHEASLVSRVLKAEFLKNGGLITTLLSTGQQWDAPNGWAPLQWVVYKAMRHYGYQNIANDIRYNWVSMNKRTYQETGKMMEKYNVAETGLQGGGGEYPNQDGFGWTNGVYLKMDTGQ